MFERLRSRQRVAGALLVCACWLVTATGCQRQKQTETGKTYTADQKAPQGGGSSAGGQTDATPLNAPADTTNGKSSKASDLGASDATRGQVVSEPGAPVEHEAKPVQSPPKTPPPGSK